MAEKVRVRNERLKALRDARRWTQKELAKALEEHAWEVMKEPRFYCAVRKLQSWEAGVPPEKVAVRVLISCLGRTAAELGLEPDPEPVLPWRSDGSSVTVPERATVTSGLEDEVHRRQFVTTMAAVFAAPALIGAKQHLSMDHVTELNDAAERLRVIDNQIGGDHLHPIAGRYIQKALPLLEASAPEAVRTAMHSAIGGMAASAGWYAYDAAEHAQARIYLSEALLHARMAADPQLEVQILNSAAHVALKDSRSHEALRMARCAQRLANASGTPRVRAVMTMREALAWSQLHETPAAEAAIARAWEHWAVAGPQDDEPAWVAFVNEGELLAMNAGCDTDLDARQPAVTALERSMDMAGPFLRNRASRATHLAHARLALGEVDGACEAAEEATRLVASSSRTRNLLTTFAKKLSGSDAPAAREFMDRWRAHPI